MNRMKMMNDLGMNRYSVSKKNDFTKKMDLLTLKPCRRSIQVLKKITYYTAEFEFCNLPFPYVNFLQTCHVDERFGSGDIIYQTFSVAFSNTDPAITGDNTLIYAPPLPNIGGLFEPCMSGYEPRSILLLKNNMDLLKSSINYFWDSQFGHPSSWNYCQNYNLPRSFSLGLKSYFRCLNYFDFLKRWHKVKDGTKIGWKHLRHCESLGKLKRIHNGIQN